MALKQWDSGIHDQQVAKVSESVNFNSTFDTTPVVFVTSYQIANPAKGTGASNITTTGFDLYGENTGDHGWVAVEEGYDEGSSSSSSSSLSSSSSSSSLSSSSLSSSSAIPATKVWGRQTGTQEDYQNTFTGNWTTSGGWFPSGSGDTETLNISGGDCNQVSISQDWYLGSFEAIIFTDKYDLGSGIPPIIYYKTSVNKTGLSGATWTLYNGVSFPSLGWVRLKIIHS